MDPICHTDGRRRVLHPRNSDDARQRMWSSMRVLRRFTRRDLELVTEANKHTVKRFLWLLVKHGWLTWKPNGVGRLYELLPKHNTGPQAPRVSAEHLTDLNTGLVYRDGAAEVLVQRKIYRLPGGSELARINGVKR